LTDIYSNRYSSALLGEVNVSLESALLGFLSYRPMTGYDMKKLFDHVIAPFWTAPQSQIYTALYRLEAENCVQAEIVRQDTKPNRKLYRITAKGEGKLRDWLSLTHPPESARSPFLLQLWLSGLAEDGAVLRFLSESVEKLRRHLAELEAKPEAGLDSSADPVRDRFFWWMTLNYGIRHTRFLIDWIEDAIDRIRRGDSRNGKEGALRGLFDTSR
jgi:PadR family transcriptional regulator AphA